jgi:hypothetical protein
MEFDSKFNTMFIVVIILAALSFVANAWFATEMYDACLDSGKTKAQCLKEAKREIEGRGHNINIEK